MFVCVGGSTLGINNQKLGNEIEHLDPGTGIEILQCEILK